MSNSNRDDYDAELGLQRQQGNDMNALLNKYFTSDRATANKIFEDALARYSGLYDKYGGMFDAYGEPAKTGFREEYDFARGGYRDLAEGWTPLERQEFQSQAVAPNKGLWDAFKMQQERNKAATGAIGPGWTEANQAAVRQSAYDAGEAGLKAKVQGRQLETGEITTGLAGETGIAGAINANRFQGMSGQMGALGGQMSATEGMAGIGAQYASMSNADLQAMLQAWKISSDNIVRLMELRASEPTKFQQWMDAISKGIAGAMEGFKIGGGYGAAAGGVMGISGSLGRGGK